MIVTGNQINQCALRIIQNTVTYWDYNEIKTIFLNKDFWWASVRDQSILLHELIHHMQYTKNWEQYRKKCKGHIEKEAYDLQEKWLEQRGLTLAKTIDLGPLMRHVLTQCDFF